jgi:hypothetical protein
MFSPKAKWKLTRKYFLKLMPGKLLKEDNQSRGFLLFKNSRATSRKLS